MSAKGETQDPGRIELLAPAGGPPALQAGLSAGADAVYAGFERWSARAFAGNFDAAELTAAVDRAHLYGARLHLALNVSLKQEELGPALAALEAPYRAGLDALIVADLPFADLVRRAYPGLALHASTQLDTHSSAQLELLARLGFSRAVLARELSLAEIAALDSHGLELEAFVHGALCYGYSGACLLSSMASGRSGNRGRCSQACRMRYRLEPAGGGAAPATAGAAPPPGPGPAGPDLARVLSTSDLAAIGALPGLLAAGVTSFKIEGRMKDPGYVGVTTAVYREALDAALADPAGYAVLPEWTARLEQSFSRGFTTGHLEGRHAEVRSGDRGGHRGVLVGRVVSVDEARGEATVRVTAQLQAGDVVQLYTVWGHTEPVRLEAALAGGRPTGAGPVDRPVAAAGERVVVRVRERVSIKDRLFRLSSGEIDAASAALVAGRALARPVPLAATLSGAVGERPRLTLRADGEEAAVSGERPLQAAKSAPVTAAKARDAIGGLGGTPYRLAELAVDLPADAFLGVGDLKALRRRAIEELDRRRLGRARRAAPPAAPAPAQTSATPAPTRTPASPRVASRDLPVVVRVRPGGLATPRRRADVVCLDVRVDDDPVVVAAARERARKLAPAVALRSPEILFDADREWWREVAAPPWDVVYARHALALEGTASVAGRVVLDYPLQGLGHGLPALLGARGIVASPEMTLDEIAAAAAALRAADPAAAVEVVAFGREQVLVTRDALGRAEGLASGEPLGPAQLTLTDARGFAFPVAVTAGGTRIANARVTNVAGHLGDLAEAGVTAVIVCLDDMDAAEREAFDEGGVEALAAFVSRDRSTTGHLFRGVA